MAMLFEYGPDRNDIRKAFNKAVAEGSARFLLLIDETLEDKYAIHNHTCMRTVESACQIEPLLRAMDKETSYAHHRLTGVFDLKQDFDKQISTSHTIESILPAYAVRSLKEYGEEKSHARAVAEWNSQPFLTRLFSAPPMKPK